MFESLLEWCTASVSIKKPGKRKASGDVEYSDPVAYNCYRADQVLVITDKTGKEYVSGTQIYFPPEVPIAEEDMIVLPVDSKPREVRKIGGFLDGNTGETSIRVVYL